jgi:cobalt/nickel transport system permease protein
MIPTFLLQKEEINLENKAVKHKLSFIDKTMKNAASFITASFSHYNTSKKEGLLQSVDPRVKVCFMLCFAIIINLTHNITFQLILFFIFFSFCIFSRVKLLSLYKKAALIGLLFGFLVFVPACLNIFTKGHLFFMLFTFSKEHQWWIYKIPKEIYITREGILIVLKLTFKVMNSVSLVLIITSTTTFEGIVKSLSYFKVPGIFLLTLTMSYKYIFVLSRTVEETYFSLKMRWWNRGSVIEAENLIAGRIGYLFQKSWERYELSYQSMIARGFSGSFKFYHFEKLKRFDFIFISISLFLLIFILISNFIYA